MATLVSRMGTASMSIGIENEAIVELVSGFNPVSYTHLTLPTNREV